MIDERRRELVYIRENKSDLPWSVQTDIFGPSLVKLVASQCLVEVPNEISEGT